MSNKPTAGAEQAQVQRTVALLGKRGSADLFTKLAVEKKISETPPHIVALAKSHLAKGSGGKPATREGGPRRGVQPEQNASGPGLLTINTRPRRARSRSKSRTS